MKKVIKIKLLIFISSISLFVLAEIYVRLFADYNEPCFDNKTKIIKRKKNTSGNYKTRYTNTGYYKINNHGWNSTRDYYENKEEGVYRIAVAGHSNVEGLRNHVNKNFPKILEDKLTKDSINAEVYTFGFAGMNLAQALYIGRYVAKTYNPDLLIIGTLTDDFVNNTTEHTYFLSLDINKEGGIYEFHPDFSFRSYYKSESPLYFLYFSRFVKYVDNKFDIGNKIFKTLSKNKLLFSKEYNKPYANMLPEHYLNLQNKEYKEKVKKIRGYIFQEFSELGKIYGTKILYIGFPVAPASFNPYYYDINEQIRIRKEIKQEITSTGTGLIDFSNIFEKDYLLNRTKFDFPGDAHLNEYGQNLIGISLAEYIKNDIIAIREK